MNDQGQNIRYAALFNRPGSFFRRGASSLLFVDRSRPFMREQYYRDIIMFEKKGDLRRLADFSEIHLSIIKDALRSFQPIKIL